MKRMGELGSASAQIRVNYVQKITKMKKKKVSSRSSLWQRGGVKAAVIPVSRQTPARG